MNAVLQFFARIQNRLLIAMLTVTAIPLIAVMIQASRQTTDALVSQAHESLQYEARYRALGLQMMFQYSTDTVLRVQREKAFRTLIEPIDDPRLERGDIVRDAFDLFRRAVEDSPLTRLSYFELTGIDPDARADVNLDLSFPMLLERSEGLESVARQNVLNQLPTVGFHRDCIGLVVVPVDRDRQRVGILIGTVSSQTIRQHLADQEESGRENRTGYLLTQGSRSGYSGITLLRPGPQNQGTELALGAPLSEVLGEQGAGVLLARPKGRATFSEQTWAWDSLTSGPDLVVGVVQDQQTLLEPVADARRIFLFILAIALILSVLLCVVFARQLTKPIDELRQGARELAAGRLDRRIHVETGDEIELLAADFNSMAEALEQSQHLLEQRIEEKTEELQRANRVLMQTEKLRSLGEVAAGVAHEINNPAGIVSMYAEMLLEKPDLEERDRKKLQLILENAERISGIAGGMLDFSRTHEFSADPVSVLAPLEKALSLVSIQKIASDVDIVRDLPEVLPPVRGDENQLIQVFLNLMTNALQAMPKGGRLTVSARALEDRVEVRVSDTGTGIDSDNLEKLFEPFFTTKAPGEGTGLGLSISYGIIRNHSGELSVESTGEHGTTFLVCLPRLDRDASTQG